MNGISDQWLSEIEDHIAKHEPHSQDDRNTMTLVAEIRRQRGLIGEPINPEVQPTHTPIGHPCERGHDFKPRYDLKQMGHLNEIAYVHDVCQRCGATISPPPKKDNKS